MPSSNPTTAITPANLRTIDKYTQEEKEIIRNQIAKGCTDTEVGYFLTVCKSVGLSPFSKQIYCIKRGAGATIQVSIDGFRAIAARTKQLAGIDQAIYDTESAPNPNKASVTVWRLTQGQRYAYTGVARWEEYKQDAGPMWKRMPYLMLAKCAESLALRKAFPNELSDLYTHEEMGQADNAEEPRIIQKTEIATPKPGPVQVTTVDETPAEARRIEEDAKQRIEIVRLTQSLGFLPKSVEEWNVTIKTLTNYDLVSEQYPAIIERLSRLVANKAGKESVCNA
ncbi:MAG: phage recombination protein Bet [Patescibacteria group bacterium]